ncbi:MAG: hypothetical protein JXL97_02710 [Bacteroidales bacterium]|nr:hypothetical protein [Bacteroidales bacterium]
MNKPININNYEQFAIDYMEGNLDEATKKAFEDFLKQNPTIKEEIEDLLDFKLSPEVELNFEDKLDLKKSGIEEISLCEYLCIADIEGTITSDEQAQLEEIFNENPELLKEYKQFIKTKLEVERTKYPSSKHELKQSEIEEISYIEYLFISKLEGTITNEESIELDKILNENPDLQKKYGDFSNLKLEPEVIENPIASDNLKMSEIEEVSYIEYLLIAKAEGTISNNENIELNNILSKNIKFNNDLEQYQNLKLEADKDIIYPNKGDLKHSNKATIRTIGTVISALAAMFIIFFGIKAFIGNNNPVSGNSCIVSTEKRFHREIIQIDNKENVNEIINETNDTYFQNNYNQVIVEENITDTTSTKNDEYFESNNYEQILAYEDFEEKEINLKLTQLKEHKRRYSDIPKSYVIPNEYEMIAEADKGNKAQKVVDFLVTTYNGLTENDVTMKVEIDEKNKCYGIEVNEKNYEICFADNKFLNKF